mmetsp:Transcript_73291/g.203275  ORF Transcript_73291/g.203275 Transcript_73291/m.203275 type:complete len:449 (+) Transcript_73291:186-1532(+)
MEDRKHRTQFLGGSGPTKDVGAMPSRLKWLGHCRLLRCAVAVGFLSTDAQAKMVMGIASGDDYSLVSQFCFTFPPRLPGEPVSNGHIHSQTIVSSNAHKFLVLNYSEFKQKPSCDELVRRAKVVEPLTERTKEVVAYDLTLNVEPSMDHQHIATVIARCGQPISAEYIVEFSNPGGYLQQHFACSDQGLLQTYLCYCAAAATLAPAFYSALRVLHRRQAHNDVSALFFTSGGFFGARVLLFTGHLVVYSQNGLGLGMLLFVAQFLDFLATNTLTLVLLALVHGVYVTRPIVPHGSDERRTLLQVIGGFTGTHLLSTLACGFKVDGELSAFGVLHSASSWPYVIVRAYTGVFAFRRGLKLAQETEAVQKKHLLLRFSFMALIWLETLPVIMLSSGEDSWHHDALIMEIGNFCLYGTLLYAFWPSRFSSLFSCIKPTERMHPYSEFGLSD